MASLCGASIDDCWSTKLLLEVVVPLEHANADPFGVLVKASAPHARQLVTTSADLVIFTMIIV
jgi:hypothetical protein